MRTSEKHFSGRHTLHWNARKPYGKGISCAFAGRERAVVYLHRVAPITQYLQGPAPHAVLSTRQRRDMAINQRLRLGEATMGARAAEWAAVQNVSTRPCNRLASPDLREFGEWLAESNLNGMTIH
jgi:hypothetical protein